MKKRKGFTLIELMIVIAIIIILAAIAIPNYLRMTERARRSRVAGDFTSIATALEAYSVDWGHYPLTADAAAEQFGRDHVETQIHNEIIGVGGVLNVSGNTTLTGEDGGIEYIKSGTLGAMYNPFIPTAAAANDAQLDYWYATNGTTGTHWALAVQYDAATVLYRSDMTTDLTEVGTHHGDEDAAVASVLAIDDDGEVAFGSGD